MVIIFQLSEKTGSPKCHVYGFQADQVDKKPATSQVVRGGLILCVLINEYLL